jgi:hypothetical protein
MRVSGGTRDVVDGEERQLLYTILDTFERTLDEIERSKYCVVVDVSILDEAAQGPALGIGTAMGGETHELGGGGREDEAVGVDQSRYGMPRAWGRAGQVMRWVR